MKNYRLLISVEVKAVDPVDAGRLIGEALGFADEVNIVEFFEEVE